MHTKPMRYVIRLSGQMDPRWVDGFADVAVRHTPSGETVLVTGPLDQAALHGLLGRIRDIGSPLIAVLSGDDHDAATGQPADLASRPRPPTPCG